MDHFFESFTDLLKTSFPKTFERFGGAPPVSPYQASPAVVELPNSLNEIMTQGASAFWSAARDLFQTSDLRPEFGVCTSFDFHVSHEQAKLIEVNTNASLSLIFHALEVHHGLAQKDFLSVLTDSFLNEHRLRTDSDTPPRIAIVDENIEQQKMRLEFYLFQELFERKGLTARVVDLKDIEWDAKTEKLTAHGEEFDFVYNRHTDFYFKQPQSQHLKAAYESCKITVTPNPSNYTQLADKRVLIELGEALAKGKLSNSLQRILLKSHAVQDFDSGELWSRRKEFFFKPVSSHGSKGVYKGKSISRKVFDQILEHDYIAQELFPPARTMVGEQEFKYDIRLITYGPQSQIFGARLYQGQLTNFGTLGGGAAPLRWV